MIKKGKFQKIIQICESFTENKYNEQTRIKFSFLETFWTTKVFLNKSKYMFTIYIKLSLYVYFIIYLFRDFKSLRSFIKS